MRAMVSQITDQKIIGGLSKARYEFAFEAVRVKALLFALLLHKAGFRPDQLRVPAGDPDGGQWAEEGLDRSFIADNFPLILIGDEEPLPPKIPDEEPPTNRARNQIAVAIAEFIYATNDAVKVAELSMWLYDYANARIVAYLDEPKLLHELREAVENPQPGYEIHHIVEQTPARQDGFSEEQINSPDNLVLIPTYRHWQITAWYARGNKDFGGLSPREFLRGERWEMRVSIGKQALKLYGVLKP